VDHVFFLDPDADVLEKLVTGEKTMIVCPAPGRQAAIEAISPGDGLYFIQVDQPTLVRLRAVAKEVIQPPTLDKEDARQLLRLNQNALLLSPEQMLRWQNRTHLMLVALEHLEVVDPFQLHLDKTYEVDEWLSVADIQALR
jgi:hypothetical protein